MNGKVEQILKEFCEEIFNEKIKNTLYGDMGVYDAIKNTQIYLSKHDKNVKLEFKEMRKEVLNEFATVKKEFSKIENSLKIINEKLDNLLK